MAQVAVLKPCVCGKPGLRREIEFEGEIASFMSCDECFDTSNSFLTRMRPVFEAMRSVGVPREIANEAMSFLLDKIDDTDKLVMTALELLRKANERGEVGYAEPTDPESTNTDWEAFQDALDKGWLRYGYDASPDIFSKYHGQRRTIYIVTSLGSAALCSSSEPVS